MSCGNIAYADRDRYDGTLVYIKPAFYGRDEPLDIANYAMAHAMFPHDTTADQFFSESQFESYRALGAFAAGLAAATIDQQKGTLWKRFVASAAEYVNPPRFPTPVVTPVATAPLAAAPDVAIT